MTDTYLVVSAVEMAVHTHQKYGTEYAELWKVVPLPVKNLFDGFDDFNTACGIHEAFDFESENYQS